MKKVIFAIACMALFVSCGKSTKSTSTSDSTADSTVVDSTVDSTVVDTL